MTQADGMASPSSNADWTRDETVLLMALYLRHPKAEKRHPEVIALSALLRGAARARGASIATNFRNPAGVAMKLRNFAKSDPAPVFHLGKGLRGGGKIDGIVWGEFGSDPAALAREAARIRKDFASGGWMASAPSKGPAPDYGERVHVRHDLGSLVYLILVDGPIDLLVPGRSGESTSEVVMKVGRTVDLERRIVELRAGLPPCAAIAYVPMAVREFDRGDAAHDYEQKVLTSCHERRWCLGGEFVMAHPDEMLDLMDCLEGAGSERG